MNEDRQSVKLTAIRFAADGTHLFEFEPLDGAVRPFAPGAHIDIFLPNGLTRQYSLCNMPGERDAYVVGVKLDRASRGGSRYMHEQLRVGAVLGIAGPRNHFALHEAAAHSVFVAGGIGITPIAAMVQQLKTLGRSWELHYSVRTRAEAAFLRQLGARNVFVHADDEHAGRFMDIAEIVRAAPAEAELYCCGPEPMLDAFLRAAQAHPQERVHVERFSADVEVAADGGFTLELARSGKSVRVQPGQTILEAARAAGCSVRASCEQGVCGACETRVLSGTPDHRDKLLSEGEKAANDVMMICCSGSLGQKLVLDL